MTESYYKEMFNTEIILELGEQTLIERSKVGKNTIFLSSIKRISELNRHIIIWLINGSAIIIPKYQVNDFELNAFTEKIRNKISL